MKFNNIINSYFLRKFLSNQVQSVNDNLCSVDIVTGIEKVN